MLRNQSVVSNIYGFLGLKSTMVLSKPLSGSLGYLRLARSFNTKRGRSADNAKSSGDTSPGDGKRSDMCPPKPQLRPRPPDDPMSKPFLKTDPPKIPDKIHIQSALPEGPNRTPIYIILGLLLASGAVYMLQDTDTTKVNVIKPKDILKKRKRKPEIDKKPPTSEEIPSEIPYLLIGGGTASFSAFRAIKSIDPKAKVLVVSNEPFNPYMRPPLSKEMFFNEDRLRTKKLEFKQWNGTERSLFYEPVEFYASIDKLCDLKNGGVSVAQGWTVKKIDILNNTAILEDGKTIKYNKCLIATGASPKNLPIFEKADEKIKDRIILFRGISDFEELESIIESGAKSIAVIGGGFLGSELACALARRGKSEGLKVLQIFKEEGNLRKILPEYLSEWTTKKVEKEGVQVITKSEIEAVSLHNDSLKLKLSNGDFVAVDYAIVAIGVEPNTQLAETSDLEVDKILGGFLVNAELEARSNLFVAGDCACFYDVKFGRRRVEHHDHAVVSGRLAGENMTGAGKPYWHQSMFWSDLGPDVGFEAIGIVDSTLPTIGVYAKSTENDTPQAVVAATDNSDRAQTEENAEPVTPALEAPSPPKPGEEYNKGVIFYLRNDIVVGIVLWNVFNRMQVARQVLKDERKFEDLNEVAKLFNIHSQ